jgi:hypothetical protein
MYRATDQPVAETFTNSLCRDIGHDWKPTPVSNYRLCQRTKCKAAQRLHHGQWTNVTTQPDKNRIGTLSCHTEQTTKIWASTEPNQQGA